MGFDIQRILVATAFSEHSGRVLEYGAALARVFEAEVLVFHALDAAPTQPFHHAIHPDSFEGRLLLEEALTRMAEMMSPHPIPWSPRVCFGEPVQGILDLMEQERIDLTVITRWGLSGLKRFLMGTVVERLVRQAARPILAIHPPEAKPSGAPERPFEKKRVVVGCEAPPDPGVLDLAAEFASRFQADLVLLHAAEAPPDQDAVWIREGPFDDVQRDYPSRLAQGLRQGVPPSLDARCRVHPLVRTGLPGEEITAFVRDHPSDLVVVGVRPSGTLEKYLIGSTTETVLRQASCPVLTVPSSSAHLGARIQALD